MTKAAFVIERVFERGDVDLISAIAGDIMEMIKSEMFY
jgi:hypothetical protein